MSPAVAAVLRALDGRGLRRAGDGWTARCAAHDDRRASLSIAEGEGGRVLLRCHAGCETAVVVECLGLHMADLMPEQPGAVPRVVMAPSAAGRTASNGHRDGGGRRIAATYAYRDEGGALLFEVVRFEPKDFRQRRPDGNGGWTWGLGDVRRVLYRLPELLTAPADAVVYVVEGEKDADRLAALGCVATTNPGGVGKWRPEYGEAFRGRWVVVLPDADDVGRKHAADVAAALRGIAARVVVIELDGLPPKGDVSDWLAAGHTADEVRALAALELDGGPTADAGAAPAEMSPPTDSAAPTLAAKARGDGAHVVTLATVEPREVEWLWPGRLPAGMVAVLDGPPGAGKSTVVVDIIARLTTGQPLPNEAGASRPPADVVLLGHEDSPEHTIRPRLDAAGADPKRVHLLADVAGRLPRLPGDGDAIERAVRETRARLLVVDPVSAYIGAADLHRDNEVRAALAPLAVIAERTGAAVLLLRHLRKSGGTDAIGRGLGSVAIIALARAGLMLLADPDDPKARVLAWSKLSVGPLPASLRWRWATGEGQPRITWEGTCDLTADAILSRQDRAQRGGGGEERATATDAAEAFLADRFAERGEIPEKELLPAGLLAGHTGRRLRAARERLGIKSKRVSKVGGKRGEGEWILYASTPRARPADDAPEDTDPFKAPQECIPGILNGGGAPNGRNPAPDTELARPFKAPSFKAPMGEGHLEGEASETNGGNP